MLPPLHPSNPASLEGLLVLQQHVGSAPCSLLPLFMGCVNGKRDWKVVPC